MKIFKYLSFFLVLLMPICVLGQQADSVDVHYDSLRIVRFSIQKMDTTVYQEEGAVQIDTNLNHFQYNDPIKRTSFFNSSLGNTGLASQNMVFGVNPVPGFSYGMTAFEPYMTKTDEANFYYSLLPMTDLFYTIGPKKEHVFHVAHLHSIKNKVFLGANYQIVGAPGRDRFQQKASDHSVSVYAYYASKNKRYGVFVNYIYNRVLVQENGGLADDTVYIKYRQGDNSMSPTYYLSNSENKIKETVVTLKQYYSFGSNPHTNKDDSIPVEKKFNVGRLSHTFTFDKERMRFINKQLNQGYFPLIPLDTTPTYDSLMFYHLDNTLAWTNSDMNGKDLPRRFRYTFEATHSYTEVHQFDKSYFMHVVKPSVGLTLRLFRQLSIEANAEYALFNSYNNDFTSHLVVKETMDIHGKSFGIVSLKFSYSKTNPPWFYEHFYSKYFQWDYDFLKQQTMYAGFNFAYKNLSVGVAYYNLFNYVYMDANARPKQYVGSYINALSAYAFKNFVIGKFEIDNKVVYQYIDKTNLLRRPQWAAMQSYFFSTHMFKKALFAQFGIDLLYNTKYYADAYQPATRSFYLQNERKVGNYLFADVFVNMKVKRVRFYFKLTNFLSGLIGYDNFTVPHYPMPDRTFNFGASWIFHD